MTRPVVVAHDVCDAHALVTSRAGGARAIEQNRVEHLASHGKSAVAEAAKAVPATKSPAITAPFGARTRMPASAAAPDRSTRVERAHLGQNARRFRAQILGARLRARKARAIHDVHVDAGARQREGHRRAGRPTADDEHVRIPHSELYRDEQGGQKSARRVAEKVDHVVVEPRPARAAARRRFRSRASAARFRARTCRTSVAPEPWRRAASRRSAPTTPPSATSAGDRERPAEEPRPELRRTSRPATPPMCQSAKRRRKFPRERAATSESSAARRRTAFRSRSPRCPPRTRRASRRRVRSSATSGSNEHRDAPRRRTSRRWRAPARRRARHPSRRSTPSAPP